MITIKTFIICCKYTSHFKRIVGPQYWGTATDSTTKQIDFNYLGLHH